MSATESLWSKYLDPTAHRRQSHKPGLKLGNSHVSTAHSMTTTEPPTIESLPIFSRRPSVRVKQSPKPLNKPVTTNLLHDEERADLVRKSRKLTRLFGETPNAEAVVNPTSVSRAPIQRKSSLPDARSSPTRHRFNRRYSLPLSVNDMPVEFSEEGTSPTITRQASMSSTPLDDPHEGERRKKPGRLAKLSRFLGSQVPINLVLGINGDSASSLPPPQQHTLPPLDIKENRYQKLLNHRRSSSAILSPSTWSDDVERLKADINNRDKAMIVRRAQKMEKLFGVVPPLPLYFPRPATAPPSGRATPAALDVPDYIENKTLTKDRPDTPESSKCLLQRRPDSFISLANFSSTYPPAFYNQHQPSLNSLNDIVEADDKVPLAELHQTLLSGVGTEVSNVKPGTVSDNKTTSPRTSMISVESERNCGVPDSPDSFQQRKKRAAKLTHFFGVDYKELFDDVLENIGSNMQLAQNEGMLAAA